jgi:hypothetical protein
MISISNVIDNGVSIPEKGLSQSKPIMGKTSLFTIDLTPGSLSKRFGSESDTFNNKLCESSSPDVETFRLLIKKSTEGTVPYEVRPEGALSGVSQRFLLALPCVGKGDRG